MPVRYGSDADVIFVLLRTPLGEPGGKRLDDTRSAHLDTSGRVFAYEFLTVSSGISFDGIATDDLALMTEALQPVKRLAVA